jgi:hypothetical protein
MSLALPSDSETEDPLGERAPRSGVFGQIGYDRLAILLFLVAFVLVLATFSDYGVTWDEDYHFWYGFEVIDYYRSLFQDTTALNAPPISYYGSIFDTTTALLSQVSPLGAYETRHLLNGIIGVIGVIGCWKLARRLGGPRAGFWAATLLLLTPNYYGHMFNNPKDIPFAAAYVWSLYYIVRLLPALPSPPWRDTAKLGLAIGLGLAVRVGGLLPLCYLGLAGGLMLSARAWRVRSIGRGVADTLVALGQVLLPVLLIAWPLMLVFWPWAQPDPIFRPLQALVDFSHHPFPYEILFDGRYYYAATLPRLYLPVHVLLKLPELVLILAGACLPWGLWRLARRPPPPAEAVIGYGLVGFAALFPIVYAMAIRATLFDGMRHFIFVIPPLACLAGLALDRAARLLDGRGAVKALAGAAVVLYLGSLVALMAALHPDEYVYYNAFAGGVPGAAGRFKLDYWANSYREAVLDLTAWLKARDGARFAHTTYHVAACGPPTSARYYLPPNLVYTEDRDKADFYIAFTMDGCDKSIPGRPVARVERLGTLLSVVLDLRHEHEPPGAADVPRP